MFAPAIRGLRNGACVSALLLTVLLSDAVRADTSGGKRYELLVGVKEYATKANIERDRLYRRAADYSHQQLQRLGNGGV